MARNPRTGEPVPLEERFIPTFKVSSEFQEKVHDRLRESGTTHGDLG
jgi:nucleoid DNA-binding protein